MADDPTPEPLGPALGALCFIAIAFVGMTSCGVLDKALTIPDDETVLGLAGRLLLARGAWEAMKWSFRAAGDVSLRRDVHREQVAQLERVQAHEAAVERQVEALLEAARPEHQGRLSFADGAPEEGRLSIATGDGRLSLEDGAEPSAGP